ncbi:Na+/H+ antiporter NhaC [Virgibacillus sp. NKC19-16]|uniref:Na+/H+ antiporter NhaC n=1 Tax=Virgibacillus salidurans TaxID=2831673 RepID=UPI001F3B8709|nr:Na+/H+ antiporter NhaC [Virgibacillus sp. NKC19-16]UJL45792.1 Na+/H+ antiporter NhaC [Virgibacillus sp. NKC19-16]
MSENKLPSLKFSILTLLTATLIMVIGLIVFDASLQIMLFIGFITVIPFAMKLGFSFSEVEAFAYDMVRKILPAALILLAVGALIGAWMYSGTVPTIIYAGLKVISPEYFLSTAVIMCIFVSLATGTSWGTIGTAGVALVGVGSGLGIPAGITVGAIITGAWFGDKMSPLSASTNMAPAISGGVDLFKHIKHMMWTTVPAVILSIIVFQLIGFRYRGADLDYERINMITSSLDELFKIGWIALIPAAVVLTLLIMKKPPVTSIFLGALIGAVVGVLHQGFSITDGFSALYGGFSIEAGNSFINGLLNRGGVTSMYEILALFIFALAFGGVLSGAGFLSSILNSFSKRIKTNRGLLLSTIAVSYTSNMIGATHSFALIMTATLMRPLYEKRKIKRENLSRLIEDVGTLGGPIIPWNTSAVFIAGTLGVSPMEFIPFCLLTFFTLLITVIYSITGFTITLENDKDTLDDSSKQLSEHIAK